MNDYFGNQSYQICEMSDEIGFQKLFSSLVTENKVLKNI